MIVEELRLKNWRGYRTQASFAFDAGLNLLVGPNEAGKSTLFEAISRCLFDRHNSKTAELKKIQPLGSSLGPEVELLVRSSNTRYRIHKRFLDDPRSELWAEREGRFELDHEGDRADEQIRLLLRGQAPRGAAKPAQRGLGHALWYLQRDAAIPSRSWNQALHEGLRGLLKVSLSTPEQDAVLKRLDQEVRSTFTATGRVSAKSELAALRKQLPVLEQELAERREEIARAGRYRDELQRIEARQNAAVSELEAARYARDSIDQILAESPALAERRRNAEAAVESAERRLSEISSQAARLKSLSRRIKNAQRGVRTSEEKEDELQSSVRDNRRAAERHARRWEDDLEPKLEAVRQQIAELRSKLRIEQLEHELETLEQKVGRARELEREMAREEKAAQALSGPSEQELNEARQLAERSRTLFERAESSAARVSFQLESGVEIESRPAAKKDPGHDEYLVTRPTIFKIGRRGTVRVRSGDDSTARFDLQARDCARELQAICARYQVEDLDALEESAATLRASEVRRQEISTRMAELMAGRPRTEEAQRLREVRRELLDLRRRSPQAVLPGLEGWAEERTLEQIWELEERKSRIERSLRESREAEHRAQNICLKQNEELVTVSQRTAGLRSEVQALRLQRRDEIEPWGTADELERAVGEATDQIAAAKAALGECEQQLAEKLEGPAREREQLASQVGVLERQVSQLAQERTDRLARIEEVTALSLDSRIGDLEGRADATRRRLEVVERRAAAAIVASELLHHLQNRQADELSRPVAGLVDGWLRELTGNQYAELLLDDDLLPQGLISRRYDREIPLESLSYGTHEQVVVLLRLAMGVLLSREEPQLVILDDRLVNADEDRMPRLCRILEQAGASCQILLATCREAPFRDLRAKVHRIGGHTGQFPRRVVESE